jgi:S-adenosylmethionine hydrolase
MPNFLRFGISVPFLLSVAFSFIMPISAYAAGLPVIGLFTDYGWDDPYVAQMKGVIITINPNARILDITHSVQPFNIIEGSYLLDQCAQEFPPGTIFVAVVDPQVGADRDPVLLQTTKGKFYVGPDNGLFSAVIAREGFDRAWQLDKPAFFRPGSGSHTFHGRDIFGPVAAHLADGTDPDKMGTPVKTLVTLPIKDASMAGTMITTEIVHIDRYGNVILNLANDSDLATKLHEGNLVKISVGHDSYSAPLVKTYDDIEKGRMMLLYGSNGLLEIAVNQGSAAAKMKIEPGASVFLKP